MRAIWLAVALFFGGCQEISFEGKGNDVPTSGEVSIGFERGDSLMVEQWLEIFHSQYPKAKISAVFGDLSQLTTLLLTDSLNGVFVHEKFNNDQIAWLKQQKNSTINEIELGATSIAFITSHESQLTHLSLDEIYNDLFGKLNVTQPINTNYQWAIPSRGSSEWRMLSSYFAGKNFVKNSTPSSKSIPEELIQKYLKSNPGTHVKWIQSQQDIINWVCHNPNAIGIVSLNFIADKKDSLGIANSKNIKVISLGNSFEKAVYPFQSQISLQQYPFIQPVISYEMQGYSGLIGGFVLYCNSQAGQALMKKSGLLPKNYQGRKIELDVPN